MVLRNFESRVFFGLVILATAVFLWMTRAFLMPVFWATVLAIMFEPIHRRLLRMLRGREIMAALTSTGLVVVVVLIPFTWLAITVTRQALGLYRGIAERNIDLAAPLAFIERSLPTVTQALNQTGVNVEQIHAAVESAAMTATQWIASQTLAIGQNIATTTVLFFLMLYLLFFLFRDGKKLTGLLIWALPIGDQREQRLFQKFAEVARATVKGTLIIATVQGAIGGILFAIVGIQGPVLWGVIMGVLSLLPAVGTPIVWIPAAIFFLATGAIWQAILLIVGGTMIIGLVDNLLRPVLVGRDTKIPDYLVLLATLGGLSMFGLAGFVVGPVIAALFLVMWEMFGNEYARSQPK